METKVCTRCHSEKPLAEFHKKHDNKDGRTTQCKACRRELDREKYDPEKNSIQCKAYRDSHKEELSEKYKTYYKEHRKELIAKNKKYNEDHREQKKAYHKEYNKTHHRPYIKKDPLLRRKWSRASSDRLWKKAIEFFGPCACCGESTREFMSVDHIKGNGGYHRSKEGWKGGGKAILIGLRKAGWPEDAKKEYRLLCFNCNFAIGHHGYCPHHPEIKYPNQCFKEEKYNGDS